MKLSANWPSFAKDAYNTPVALPPAANSGMCECMCVCTCDSLSRKTSEVASANFTAVLDVRLYGQQHANDDVMQLLNPGLALSLSLTLGYKSLTSPSITPEGREGGVKTLASANSSDTLVCSR